MPLYEYECDVCAHRFELIQKFSDPAPSACPKCGGVVHKLMSSPAIQFKGSGFYLTDYGRSGSKTDGAGAKGGKSEGGSTSGGDTKAPEGKSSESTSSESGSSPKGDSGGSSSGDSSPAKPSTPAKND